VGDCCGPVDCERLQLQGEGSLGWQGRGSEPNRVSWAGSGVGAQNKPQNTTLSNGQRSRNVIGLRGGRGAADIARPVSDLLLDAGERENGHKLSRKGSRVFCFSMYPLGALEYPTLEMQGLKGFVLNWGICSAAGRS
jgi:hypothetical protein